LACVRFAVCRTTQASRLLTFVTLTPRTPYATRGYWTGDE
jgi:hypothetical protein